MSVRARWQTATETAPKGDLLDSAIASEVGIPVDLREPGDLSEVSRQMETMDLLAARGITCPVLSMADTTCLACPISKHQDPLDPKHPLCCAGRRLDELATEYAVAKMMRDENRGADDH